MTGGKCVSSGGTGLAVGMLIGVVLGLILDNVTMGIAIGVAIGYAIIGVVNTAKARHRSGDGPSGDGR